MKVAISSAGKNLESETDPRFGRCKYFLVVDTETEEFEVLPNENADRMGGAGIKTAQLVAGLELGSVITGNIGPNAFEVLNAAGVQISRPFVRGSVARGRVFRASIREIHKARKDKPASTTQMFFPPRHHPNLPFHVMFFW